MATFLHTMVRITDPERSRSFDEALGSRFSRDMDIVRNGRLSDRRTPAEVAAVISYFSELDDADAVVVGDAPGFYRLMVERNLDAVSHRGRRRRGAWRAASAAA